MKLTLLILLFTFLNIADANGNGSHNKNWTSWGGDPQGTRYSELEQINTSNVNQLELVSTIPLSAEGNYVGGALIVDGLIYLQEPNTDTLYAYNQSTGKLQWSRKGVELNKIHKKYWELNFRSLGLAYSKNVIYWYQLSGNLLALNARTGETLWEAKNTQEEALIGGTPPIVAGNKVIVGVADTGRAVRGYLTAFNTADGSIAWRAYSYGSPKDVIYDPAKLIVNGKAQLDGAPLDDSLFSNQHSAKGIDGGTPAGWISYDPELNLIYYGSNSTKANQPKIGKIRYSPKLKPLWSSALWARNADNGELVWLSQMTPDNRWGYQGINESILTNLRMGDQDVKALIHVDQNGFNFVIDRRNGTLISATKTDDIVGWATGFSSNYEPKLTPRSKKLLTTHDPTSIKDAPVFCPSDWGMKPLQPASFSKKTGLVYIAGNKKCMYLEAFPVDPSDLAPYDDNVIDLFDIYPFFHYYYPHFKLFESGKIGGFLKAWDPYKNVYKWAIDEPYEVNSGVLATKGNVIFYGTMEGYFKAVDALTGELLYQSKLPRRVLGNISTWMHHGKQYIGVLSGAYAEIDYIFACVDGDHRKFWQEARKQLCHQSRQGEYSIFSLGNNF